MGQCLDLFQGDPQIYPLRNRVLNAVVLSSILICLGLELASILFGHPWLIHLVIILATAFYLLFYFVSRRDPRPVHLRAWFWVAVHGLLIFIDWFALSGSRGICLPIAVCVIIIIPTLLRGYRAAIGVLVILLLLVVMMVMDMTQALVDFRPDLLLDEPEVTLDRFVSVIILAIGVCGIEVLIISSHNQQKERIDALNAELKQLNQEIIEDNLELRELNQMKDSFFKILGHDLRNPIGGLSSLSKLLSQKFEGFTVDEQKEMIDLMSRSSNSALELLNNLLTWARAESGLMQVVPTRINVRDCIEDNLDLLKVLAREKSIHLLNQCSEEHAIRGDEEMINLVFRNLLSNALKFTDEGGVVLVRATRIGDRVEVRVKDSGVGMSEEEVQAVLEGGNFTKPGTAREQGTGLGLKLVQEFIQLNDGELAVSSEPGVGSCFSVELPLYQE